jgi:hypothetical protein
MGWFSWHSTPRLAKPTRPAPQRPDLCKRHRSSWFAIVTSFSRLQS